MRLFSDFGPKGPNDACKWTTFRLPNLLIGQAASKPGGLQTVAPPLDSGNLSTAQLETSPKINNFKFFTLRSCRSSSVIFIMCRRETSQETWWEFSGFFGFTTQKLPRIFRSIYSENFVARNFCVQTPFCRRATMHLELAKGLGPSLHNNALTLFSKTDQHQALNLRLNTGFRLFLTFRITATGTN